MQAIVLAGTHERIRDNRSINVPRPLLDIGNEPLLTILVRKLAALSDMRAICVVTNEVIGPELKKWAQKLPELRIPVNILTDGTCREEEALGAVGDLIFAIKKSNVDDELLVVGGDNWFTFNLEDFVNYARKRSPALVVNRPQTSYLTSRFGMLDLDDTDRIIDFQEKPEKSNLKFRASCIYFFSPDDLKWLDTFTNERSTNCTPGVFLEWLMTRVALYGFEMTATWYDIGEPTAAKSPGPDFVEFRKVMGKLVNMNDSTWEAMAARELQWTSSYEQLLESLCFEDPNRRILAAMLLGRAGHLLNNEAKENVIKVLLDLLKDPSANDYEYGAFQCDEDTVTFVSTTAAESLVRLGYAKHKAAVYAKAREEGLEVIEH